MGVTAVVRLNEKLYEESEFTNHGKSFLGTFCRVLDS